VPYAQRRGRTTGDILRHSNFEDLKATLDAMQRLTIARQLYVAVALVPSKEEVYSWVLDEAPPWSASQEPSSFSFLLREICEQRHFRFLDLKPKMVDASRKACENSDPLIWWSDDSHWNDEGQRVAAADIYEKLLHGSQLKFTELQWTLQDEVEYLVSLLKQFKVDEKQAASQLDKVLAAEREIKRAQLMLLIRVKNNLTPAQQTQLRELVEKSKGR
jgi:hypothetical protein